MLRILFILLLGTLLGGCITSDVPPTRYYILNPLPSSEALVNEADASDTLSVEISALLLPHYLERPYIVSRPSPNQLRLEDFHQWGGSLRKNMARVLATSLSHLLATPHVSIVPHHYGGRMDIRVALEVLQFERGPDDRVRLSVRWQLSRDRQSKPLLSQVTEIVSPVHEGKLNIDETVAAMSDAYAELSRHIAKAVMTHVQRKAS